MRKNANLPALIFLFVLLVIWQAGAMGMDAAYILPSPTQILVRMWELRGPLLTAHLPATLLCTGIGLAISIVLGLLLAVLMDWSPAAEKMLYPLIVASQTIPTTALAPLFVLWFGYTIWSKVLVTVLITFFPIAITVFDGFRSAKTDMVDMLRTFGAGKKEIFLKFPTRRGAALLLLRHQNGHPAVHHRRGDRRMAGCAGRPRLFQPPHDDPAGRRGRVRPHRAAERGRHAGGCHCVVDREKGRYLARQSLIRLNPRFQLQPCACR